MSKKALGRGLNALIPNIKKSSERVSSKDRASAGIGINEIELEKIIPNPSQPRIKFKEEDLRNLGASIKSKGIIQPLVVRPRGEKYEIIAGERRYLAAKRLKLKRVPIIIRKSDDEESMELALIENIQRSDLNPIEEARAYETLMEKYSLTQVAVGEKVGKSREAIANILRLLKLPSDVQKFVLDEMISMGHARALLSLQHEQQQRDMAGRVIAQKLSVRDVEKLVALKQSDNKKVKKVKKQFSQRLSPYVQSMAEKIQEKIGTKVTIKENLKKGSGKIEVEYYSHDDLDRIFHLIG